MKDAIIEQTGEDDVTPDSNEQPFKKRNSFARSNETFHTNAFESIDSFVKLEN